MNQPEPTVSTVAATTRYARIRYRQALAGFVEQFLDSEVA